MVVFGIVTEDDFKAFNALNKIRMNFDIKNPVKNPFAAKLRRIGGGWIISIMPLYPNFTIFGWIGAIGTYYIFGLTYWILPFILLGLLGVFWSRFFYMLAFILSLRKGGYRGKINFVNSSYIIENWVL